MFTKTVNHKVKGETLCGLFGFLLQFSVMGSAIAGSLLATSWVSFSGETYWGQIKPFTNFLFLFLRCMHFKSLEEFHDKCTLFWSYLPTWSPPTLLGTLWVLLWVPKILWMENHGVWVFLISGHMYKVFNFLSFSKLPCPVTHHVTHSSELPGSHPHAHSFSQCSKVIVYR